jgi:FKBP-type peptidyl-prolyl cis-trans isomerase 2
MIGFGQLLAQVEASILGLGLGGKCSLKLEPAEAFGTYDENKVVEFERDEFPADIAPGDLFDAEAEDGTVTSLTILEVHDEYVLVDLNHVLAGKCVTVEFEVLAIRPVSKSDIEAVTRARENRNSGPSDSLLPLNRLLRGRSRR